MPPPPQTNRAKSVNGIDLTTLRVKLMHAVPEHCPQVIYNSVSQRVHEKVERERWFRDSGPSRPARRPSTRAATNRSGANLSRSTTPFGGVSSPLPIRTKDTAKGPAAWGTEYHAYAQKDGCRGGEDCMCRVRDGPRESQAETRKAGERREKNDGDGKRSWRRRRFVIPDSESDEDEPESSEEQGSRDKSATPQETDWRRRYVVLSWKDWSFKEVKDKDLAEVLINPYNPWIEAGNGVMLQVHDIPDMGLHHGFQGDQERMEFLTAIEHEMQLPYTYNYFRQAEESKQRFRRELEIPDEVPEGSPLFYVIWLAVERLRNAEATLDLA